MAALLHLLMFFFAFRASHANNCNNKCTKCTADEVKCEGITIINDLSWLQETTTSIQLKGCRINNLTADTFKNLTNLQFIDLSGQEGGIKEIHSDTFKPLTKLASVLLGDNGIQSLPDKAFANLPNLYQVFLSKNSLTSLPDSLFENSVGVEQLKLDNNQLTSDFLTKLGRGDIAKNLIEVILEGTPIARIETEMFSGLPKLETLNLQQCRVNYISADMLKDTKVNVVRLSDNPIISIDANAFRTPKIATFECVRCDLTNAKIDFLKNMDTDTLTVVRLAENNLTAIKKDHFGRFPKLNQLDLTKNQIESIEKGAIGTACTQTSSCLKICENPLKCDCDLLWFKDLAKPSTIAELDCIKCGSPANLTGKAVKGLTEKDFGDCGAELSTVPSKGTMEPTNSATKQAVAILNIFIITKLTFHIFL